MRALLVLALGCTSIPDAPAPPRPTAQLAAIEASTDLDGAPIGKSDARATLVVSFASWCGHCHRELAIIDTLRAAHPGMRVLGINYRGHEEYDNRGNSEAVRRYAATHAPWLRVVPADDRLFDTLGRPSKVPTIYVYDRTGALVTVYDRNERALPDAAELRALLRRLGA